MILVDKNEEDDELRNINKRLKILWENINPFRVKTDDLDTFSSEINNYLNRLYHCSFDLLNLYKSTHAKVYTDYLAGLHDLKEDLKEEGILNIDEIEDIDQECTGAINRITTQYDIEIEDVKHVLHEVIENLQQKLKRTFEFLLELFFIYDDHFERLNKVKTVIQEDLKLTTIKNDRAAHKEEMKLNVLLDGIRQGTEDNIDEPMAKVYAILESLKKMYNAHYNAEIAVINKITQYNGVLSEVTKAELKRFLVFNPRDENVNPTRLKHLERSAPSLTVEENIKTNLVTKQIYTCNLQADSVHNWMYG